VEEGYLLTLSTTPFRSCGAEEEEDDEEEEETGCEGGRIKGTALGSRS